MTRFIKTTRVPAYVGTKTDHLSDTVSVGTSECPHGIAYHGVIWIGLYEVPAYVRTKSKRAASSHETSIPEIFRT